MKSILTVYIHDCTLTTSEICEVVSMTYVVLYGAYYIVVPTQYTARSLTLFDERELVWRVFVCWVGGMEDVVAGGRRISLAVVEGVDAGGCWRLMVLSRFEATALRI